MAVTAAGLLPLLVEGRPIGAMVALSTISGVEALIGVPRWSSPWCAAKWFVPDGALVAGEGCSLSTAVEKRLKDRIAF